MSSQHYLVATMDDERRATLIRDPDMTDEEWCEYEADECLKWSLECGDPEHCEGWMWCPHDDLPSPVDRETETFVRHGIEHRAESGEWSVDYTGCIVAWAWDGSLPDSVPRRPGSYSVDADWDDPGDAVILV